MQFGIDRREKSDQVVVRCGNNLVVKLSMDLLPTPQRSGDDRFAVGQFPSAKGSR
jgi:hypothetical protein